MVAVAVILFYNHDRILRWTSRYLLFCTSLISNYYCVRHKMTQRVTEFSHTFAKLLCIYFCIFRRCGWLCCDFFSFREFIICNLVQIQPNLLLLLLNARYVYMFQNFIGFNESKRETSTSTWTATAIPIFRSTKVERQSAQRCRRINNHATCAQAHSQTVERARAYV